MTDRAEDLSAPDPIPADPVPGAATDRPAPGTPPPGAGRLRRDAEPAPAANPDPVVAAAPPVFTAAFEPPSPDVALADEATPLPGVHRGGFLRLPTEPVSVTTETAPAEPGTVDAPEPIVQWLMPEPAVAHRGLAGWALAFSITGLVFSLFVGWAFPIGLVGMVSAILALRRPLESRAVAVWALVLGTASVLYSAGWLLFAAGRANLWG